MLEHDQFDELFLRIKLGDKLAYEKIYHTYSKELLKLAYHKTKDKTVAEDLVQNIFISIWEKRTTLFVKDGQSYLFGCLKYSIINHIRTQITENKYIAFSRNKTDLNNEVFTTVELHDLSGIIEKGVSSLPEKTQEIFRLSRFEHQSTKKISAILNISEKTVEYHITRALKFIKGYLKNYYIYIILFLNL